MAAAINTAACANDEALNASRKQKQVEVLHGFLRDMAACGFDMDGDALYNFYCRHSVHHLSTYLPEGAPLPSLRFQPMDWISRGDKVHQKMAEYMRAQDIIYDSPPGNYSEASFVEMLKKLRNRLGHVMTDEERARIPSNEAEGNNDPLD